MDEHLIALSAAFRSLVSCPSSMFKALSPYRSFEEDDLETLDRLFTCPVHPTYFFGFYMAS